MPRSGGCRRRSPRATWAFWPLKPTGAAPDDQALGRPAVGGDDNRYPIGDAYWLSSSMRNLPPSETYQLWGLARGKPVSLGLVGAHPDAIDFFKLERDITELLVTAEPEGGTTGPTTTVLAEGAVPRSSVS